MYVTCAIYNDIRNRNYVHKRDGRKIYLSVKRAAFAAKCMSLSAHKNLTLISRLAESAAARHKRKRLHNDLGRIDPLAEKLPEAPEMSSLSLPENLFLPRCPKVQRPPRDKDARPAAVFGDSRTFFGEKAMESFFFSPTIFSPIKRGLSSFFFDALLLVKMIFIAPNR